MASADELPAPLRLHEVIDRIRRHNPELSQRRALAAAAAARPLALTQLDDPTLSFEWWQQPIDFATVPLMLSVRQPLPWPGKLRARGQAAAREADSARDAVDEAMRRLEAEAKRAYFDLAFAEAGLAINDRQRTLLEAMVRATDVKYRVGRAPQAALLAAQGELLTVDNERLDRERERDEGRARLNALLDRPATAPLPSLDARFVPADVPAEAELVQLALDHRPEVRLAADAVAEAAARLDLAERESNPELAVWVGYMLNVRGVDTFTAGVSTTLPVFSSRKRSAAARAAAAELEARKAALAAARRRAEADVHLALLQMRAAERHERLHAEKLIPLADLTLQSAQAAYQNDRIDFLAVLDAARMVREHHLNHQRYLVEYEQRLRELELAVGRDLARTVSP